MAGRLLDMQAHSSRGGSQEMQTGAPGCVSAETAPPDPSTSFWPWSYRLAGTAGRWPAVEIYEAGALLDVVTSTRLVACMVRGARTIRFDGARRAWAWGRLPLDGDLPAVHFSRGRLRTLRVRVTPVLVTGWCWVAIAEGRYDAVTVRSTRAVLRRRLQVSRWR